MFLSISQSLLFLGDTIYGIWVLILSMSQWSLFFDFGLSNVLKTKIPEFIVKNDERKINQYITISYLSTSVIALILLSVSLLIIFNINLTHFFNLDFNEETIKYIFSINSILFCINIILSVNKSLFIGVNKNFYSEQSSTLNQAVFFIALIALTYFLKFENNVTKLYSISIINGFIINCINFSYTYLFFKQHNYRITFFFQNDFIIKAWDVIRMGLQFMVIQLFMVIIFFSDPYLISHYLLPEETTKYDIITKLFQLPLLVITAAMAPFWPLFSKKYHEKDFVNIKTIFTKFHLLFVPIIISIVLLGLLSNHILFLWLKKINYIEFSLLFFIVIATILRVLFTFYSNFFNGIGKLKSQIIIMGIAALIKIPISILLFKYNFGIISVLLSTCLFLLLGSLFLYLQSKKILNGK